MGETLIKFSGSQRRMLTEISKRHMEEMNSALSLIYEELGIKDDIISKKEGVAYRLLPDYSGILKISPETEALKNDAKAS